ncbi:unnamed protein product [Clonostachys rhizophaga]|uniref:Uncharacterized protein n=1 Tax=Clonostachys rhizophaga TaxID=160324 RepID=A0A9N9V259_9HYPO|nr:unnamed protein product [Clonostachys rhizophaga]
MGKTRSTKAARRRYKADPNPILWEELKETEKQEEKAMIYTKREKWREVLARTGTDEKQLWALEKWARLRSWSAYELPKLPGIKDRRGIQHKTHRGKAKALSEKFFPESARGDDPIPGLKLLTYVTEGDIKEALKGIAPWKAPGPDEIPTGFLKTSMWETAS